MMREPKEHLTLKELMQLRESLDLGWLLATDYFFMLGVSKDSKIP